jgi:diguanylate cyclase (GGDEF)-like protein
MLNAIGRGGSLRSWIATGMAIALLPLTVTALAGYLVLGRGVIASFQDVAARQRDQIDPTQRLRLLLLEAATPLDDYVDEGDPRLPEAYREQRMRIETAFAEVHDQMRSDPEMRIMVERARDDWTAADRLAAEALSVRRAPGDPRGAELMDGFHGLVGSAEDKLSTVYDDVAKDLRADHDTALRDVDRSKWLAIVAATISALAILAGVTIIGRIISGSVERLVAGAERFAAGDRDHRIDVSVPPELHRVAAEFNRMIGRIHESEDALANLARRDSLTMLLNRRAFDEELAEMFARRQRNGEQFVLLALDLDRFKQVNDRYGHGVGDDVLRGVSRTLADQLRPFDKLFRTGGEEFATILPGCGSTAGQQAAERLRRAVAAQAIVIGDRRIEATVSIGLAEASQGMQPDDLIKAADAALYAAKAAGRNRVVVAAEDGSPA